MQTINSRLTKLALLFGFLMLSFSISTSFSAEEKCFYYAFDHKIYLQPNYEKLVIAFKAEGNVESITRNARFFKWHSKKILELTFDSKESANVIRLIAEQNSEVTSVNPAYVVDEGKAEKLLTNEIVVGFKDAALESEVRTIIDLYKLKLVDENEVFKLFSVPDLGNTLEIANKIQESGLADFSHPNFISFLTPNSLPNDTYFGNQGYLHNTGQTVRGWAGTIDADIDAPEAWEMSLGSSTVKIAVLDGGLSSNHPDLPNTRQVRLNGSNFAADGSVNDPSPLAHKDGGHGNAVAGIIGATQNNNEGISGICPNCIIMPERIFNAENEGISDSQVASALLFAVNNGAAIINNSWSYQTSNPNFVPAIVSAINYAVTSGRGGKGCVVVFSIGNNADHEAGSNYDGYISFPANVNVHGVLSVGSSDRTDHQANYSSSANPNSPNNQFIDVVATSSPDRDYLDVWSMDSPSNLGINPIPAEGHNDGSPGEVNPSTGPNNLSYTAYFGATSASAAVTSGVAALMLSVNPELTQQQVFDILTSTAEKVGGYTYLNGRSNEFGFGRINACLAVRAALANGLSISGPSLVCATTAFTARVSGGPAIPVSWVSSNPNGLAINPATGVATIMNNFSGYVTISATHINQCLPITLSPKTVWVGVPDIHNSSNAYAVGYPGNPVTLNVSTMYQFAMGAVNGAETYTWQIPRTGGWSFWIYGAQGNPNYITTGSAQGLYQLLCKPGNVCGIGGTRALYVNLVAGGGGGGMLIASPNPANNLLTVKLDDLIEVDAQLDLINQSLEICFTAKVCTKQVVIDTKTMKDGPYILRIITKGDVRTSQIVIKH